MKKTFLTLSRASFRTRSVSRLFSAFIISLTSLKILVYLSWHMFWQLPSLTVCVPRCTMRGAGEEEEEGEPDFLVWVETDIRSGWCGTAVGISWLELTASISGSGSWYNSKEMVKVMWTQSHISLNKHDALQTSSLGSATWERRLFLALGSWLPLDCCKNHKMPN